MCDCSNCRRASLSYAQNEADASAMAGIIAETRAENDGLLRDREIMAGCLDALEKRLGDAVAEIRSLRAELRLRRADADAACCRSCAHFRDGPPNPPCCEKFAMLVRLPDLMCCTNDYEARNSRPIGPIC